MKKLLSADPITRTKERFHALSGGDEFVVETKQDVEPVTTVNKEKFKDSTGHYNLDGVTHVGSIPLVIWRELEKAGIAHDDEALKAWLDNPDNRAFKTHPGRLS